MPTGAITGYIDVAQVVLYVFWFFFAGLIFYLRREDKREGYPLESERSGFVPVIGFPEPPSPKTFLLRDGRSVQAPSGRRDTRDVMARPVAPWPGAPLVPTGDPMLDGVGPAAWAERDDRPDTTVDGHLRIVPLRVAGDFYLESRDPDPRGMEVVGADRLVGGTVTDVWIDRAEYIVRYLEVAVGSPEEPRSVLLPITFAVIDGRRRVVRVSAILAQQFAAVPGVKSPDEVTLLEEERICAYYGGGLLYATPERAEPRL